MIALKTGPSPETDLAFLRLLTLNIPIIIKYSIIPLQYILNINYYSVYQYISARIYYWLILYLLIFSLKK